jgi:hypothetical protein
MARLARVVVANLPHHVTQRGNARQSTLTTDGERRVCLDLPLFRATVAMHFPAKTMGNVSSVPEFLHASVPVARARRLALLPRA